MWFEFTTKSSGRKHLINLVLIRDISEDKDGNAIIEKGNSAIVTETPYVEVCNMLWNWKKLIDFTWSTPEMMERRTPAQRGPLDDDIPF